LFFLLLVRKERRKCLKSALAEDAMTPKLEDEKADGVYDELKARTEKKCEQFGMTPRTFCK